MQTLAQLDQELKAELAQHKAEQIAVLDRIDDLIQAFSDANNETLCKTFHHLYIKLEIEMQEENQAIEFQIEEWKDKAVRRGAAA